MQIGGSFLVGEGRLGSHCVTGVEFRFSRMKWVLGMDGGNSMHCECARYPEENTWKWLGWPFYVMCILPQEKKWKTFTGKFSVSCFYFLHWGPLENESLPEGAIPPKGFVVVPKLCRSQKKIALNISTPLPFLFDVLIFDMNKGLLWNFVVCMT